jgi:hypothetical protein
MILLSGKQSSQYLNSSLLGIFSQPSTVNTWIYPSTVRPGLVLKSFVLDNKFPFIGSLKNKEILKKYQKVRTN